MNRFPCLVPLLAACAVASVHAADTTTLRATTSAERLSNGTPGWRENSVGVSFDMKERQSLDLEAGETRRFGLRDTRFAASFSTPVSSAVTASVDASGSSTHQVLAQRTLGGALQVEFAPAWLAHIGARSSSYDSATVNQGALALEHYFSDYSATLGWHPTHAYGRNANVAELRASWYYGDRDSVTLIGAGGEEAASVPGGVSLTDVRSAALTGRHWLDRHWAVTWAASRTRQGSLYSRNGINLGAQYRF
jgi:YaiO family outer membrane protein